MDEGASVCETAVPELQDRAAQGNGAGDLQGWTSQAEARLSETRGRRPVRSRPSRENKPPWQELLESIYRTGNTSGLR